MKISLPAFAPGLEKRNVEAPTPEMTPQAAAALQRSGFSRRDFLKQSGALIVGFSVFGLGVELETAHGQIVQGVSPGAPPAGQLDSWIAITADGGVTAYTGRRSSARES